MSMGVHTTQCKKILFGSKMWPWTCLWDVYSIKGKVIRISILFLYYFDYKTLMTSTMAMWIAAESTMLHPPDGTFYTVKKSTTSDNLQLCQPVTRKLRVGVWFYHKYRSKFPCKPEYLKLVHLRASIFAREVLHFSQPEVHVSQPHSHLFPLPLEILPLTHKVLRHTHRDGVWFCLTVYNLMLFLAQTESDREPHQNYKEDVKGQDWKWH